MTQSLTLHPTLSCIFNRRGITRPSAGSVVVNEQATFFSQSIRSPPAFSVLSCKHSAPRRESVVDRGQRSEVRREQLHIRPDLFLSFNFELLRPSEGSCFDLTSVQRPRAPSSILNIQLYALPAYLIQSPSELFDMCMNSRLISQRSVFSPLINRFRICMSLHGLHAFQRSLQST